jgi:acetyl-CoA decarbonylase/synthase complex subunit epsilon
MPEAWKIANVPGPERAVVIADPARIVTMIREAKRPLLVVGHQAIEMKAGNQGLIKLITEMAEMKITIVATAHTVKAFITEGYHPAAWMGVVDLTNRFSDLTWTGFDGKGSYDLIMFIGIPYYLQSQMLSTLKHFAPDLLTVSLDRHYHPNADWSFPNLSEEEWQTSIEKIVKELQGQG